MKLNIGAIRPGRAFRSIKISTKVFILVGFLLALLVTVAGLSSWQMYKISKEIEEIAERDIPLTRDLTEITIHQLEQSINFERAFRAGDLMNKHVGARKEFDKAVRTFKELTGVIKTEFGEVKVLIVRIFDANVTKEERQRYQNMQTMLDRLDAEHDDYDQLSRKAFKLIDADKFEQALFLLPMIEAEENDLDFQLEKMLLEVENSTQHEVNEINEHEQLAIILMASITVIALTIGTVVSAYMVKRNISSPLSEITTGLEALGAEDMSVVVKVYNDDEIGAVAKAYESFKQTLIKLKNTKNELRDHRDHLQEKIDLATQELAEALDKEQELNKLQREFVSMASHEFRTPLTIIDGLAQRIKSRASTNRLTPEDAIERVEKIRYAVQRMTKLMDSTLSATRMQEGKLRIEIKPCDIGKVVREVCDRQQEMSNAHAISYDQARLPATIQADSSSVDQVLTNLLSNAAKYAPDASDIEVKARLEGHQVVISVRDYGIGIDADELGRIGERFFRARTSVGTAGTGIGLNLVKTLMEMHGGSVKVASAKGEGSTFTICLPVAGPEQPEQMETKVA